MEERLFSCLAGEKSISFYGKLKRIYTDVNLNNYYTNHVELRISYNNNLLVFKFEQTDFFNLKYTVTHNNTLIDQFIFYHSLDPYAVTEITFNDKVVVKFKYYDQETTRTYDISVPPGSITITLFRSHSDESYCSDVIIEYEQLQSPIIQIILLAILIMGVTVVLSVLRKLE